jgi:hypothetical protein
MKQISLVLSTFSFVTATIASPILVSSTSSVLAQTAGCGSGWSNTALKVLSPVASNQFRVACNEHDACYDTYGKSKEDCDRAFHNRMLGICGRDHNTWFGRPLKRACNGRADAYYNAVRLHGSDAYDKAQAKAAKPPFLSPLVFDPNYYLATYADLKNAFGTDKVAAERHWLSRGIIEGRQGSTDFSPKCYLERYPDLQNAFGATNYSRALTHYLNNGINERRNGKC